MIPEVSQKTKHVVMVTIGLAVLGGILADAVFYQTTNRSPAPSGPPAIWSGLLHGLADYIEADGETTKPILQTVSDVDSLRRAAILAPLHRIEGGQEVGQVLGPQLSKIEVGDLTPSKRRAVVKIFRDLADDLGER